VFGGLVYSNDQKLVGFSSNRPDLIGNPNNGPRTPQEWFNKAAFQSLNPATQAGQFGNEGRNVVQGPGFEQWDFSAVKDIPIRKSRSPQFRAEFFNVFKPRQRSAAQQRHQFAKLRRNFGSAARALGAVGPKIRLLSTAIRQSDETRALSRPFLRIVSFETSGCARRGRFQCGPIGSHIRNSTHL
jgi:hypothetical protein